MAIDSAGAKAQQSATSRANYEKATAKQTPNTLTSDNKASTLRYTHSNTTYTPTPQRATRERAVFNNHYYSSPPAYYYSYHDNFSPFFYSWLLAQSLDTRAEWAYNHRAQMDTERYAELKKDAALEARLAALEKSGVAPNSTQTPAGVDSELMLREDLKPTEIDEPAPDPGHGIGYYLTWTLIIVFVVGFIIVMLIP